MRFSLSTAAGEILKRLIDILFTNQAQSEPLPIVLTTVLICDCLGNLSTIHPSLDHFYTLHSQDVCNTNQTENPSTQRMIDYGQFRTGHFRKSETYSRRRIHCEES